MKIEFTDIRIVEKKGFERYYAIEFDFKSDQNTMQSSALRLSCADYYSIESFDNQDMKKFFKQFLSYMKYYAI